MFSLHEVFKTLEIDRINFKESCKKAGSNISIDHISRIFDKYATDESNENFLDYDHIEKIFEDLKPSLIDKFRDQQVDKATIFEALRSRLKILGVNLRQMFKIESLADGETISLYKCTEILMKELGTSGMDFTDAINKFVINLLLPGSKSEISFKVLVEEYEDYFSIEKGSYDHKNIKEMMFKVRIWFK